MQEQLGLAVAVEQLIQVVPQIPKVSAKEAASGMRLWAISRNLMQALPEVVEQAFVTPHVLPATIDPAAEAILRRKGLSAIVYNEADRFVIVFTQRRLNQKDLKTLPDEVFGCEVRYRHGEVEGLGAAPATTQGAGYAVVNAGGVDRYSCGSSISPGNSASAGTMGAIVTNPNAEYFGLTNNHVTGACSHSSIGLPVLAPGVLDVAANGLFPFTIGIHFQVLEMAAGDGGNVNISQNTDAAIFQILNPDLVSSSQGGVYDTPTMLQDPFDGMPVEKVGRTTQHTTGKVIGRSLLPFKVSASAPSYNFKADISFPEVYLVHGENGVFSESGDSGSLVVSKQMDGSYTAVGLLFASMQDMSAPGGVGTLILPLRPILDRLGVSLVGGHNA